VALSTSATSGGAAHQRKNHIHEGGQAENGVAQIAFHQQPLVLALDAEQWHAQRAGRIGDRGVDELPDPAGFGRGGDQVADALAVDFLDAVALARGRGRRRGGDDGFDSRQRALRHPGVADVADVAFAAQGLEPARGLFAPDIDAHRAVRFPQQFHHRRAQLPRRTNH
jgi:hypothetical protein